MTIKDIANVTEAMNLITSLFGSKEFTKKQYESAKQNGGACIETLRDWGIIRVARKETFEHTVNYPIRSYAVVGFNGAITFKTFGQYEYRSAERFADDVRRNNPLITDVKVVEAEKYTVTAERFYYVVDINKYNQYIERQKFEMKTALAKALEDREKLERKIASLTIALS